MHCPTCQITHHATLCSNLHTLCTMEIIIFLNLILMQLEDDIIFGLRKGFLLLLFVFNKGHPIMEDGCMQSSCKEKERDIKNNNKSTIFILAKGCKNEITTKKQIIYFSCSFFVFVIDSHNIDDLSLHGTLVNPVLHNRIEDQVFDKISLHLL